MVDEFDVIAWQHLTADIIATEGMDRLRAVQRLRRYAEHIENTNPQAPITAGLLRKHADNMEEEEVKDMAKPKPGGDGHRKPGKPDRGKSNVDKTGKTGRHHGGNLSGGGGMSDVASKSGGKK